MESIVHEVDAYAQPAMMQWPTDRAPGERKTTWAHGVQGIAGRGAAVWNEAIKSQGTRQRNRDGKAAV